MDEKYDQTTEAGRNEYAEGVPRDLKFQKIVKACEDKDLESLIDLATSKYGLLEDGYRRRAWPILLGCIGTTAERDWHELRRHHDEGQVRLDVDRAFVYYPEQDTDAAIHKRRNDLYELIVQTLRRHPSLNYFQGYHDVVQLFLLVLGLEAAVEPVARLSLLRIRDFCLPTLTGTTAHLNLLPSILKAVDPNLQKHLSTTEPFFALSATLTMYAHDIEDFKDITRLFDFLLAREASMAVYLYAAIILSRKEELLEIPLDEPEMLHFTLSKLPKPLDIEKIVATAMDLFSEHPPEKLPNRAWKQISSNSVLKTTRDSHALQAQSLKDGEKWLDGQAVQIRRAQQLENIKKHAWGMRRQGRYFGVALVVGILSFWFRQDGMLGVVSGVWSYIRSWV